MTAASGGQPGTLARAEVEVLLEALITRCAVIVYVLDHRGICTYSVGSPLVRPGPAPGTMVGQDVPAAYAHDEVAHTNLVRALGGERRGYTWTSPQGEERFDSWLEPVLDASGAVASVVGISVDVTGAWRAEACERDRAIEQQDVLHQLIAVQDAERERISAGLHDDTVQVLAALALRVSTLRRHLGGSDPFVEAEMSAMSRDLAQAGGRLRDLVAGLQPELITRGGLAAAVQDLLVEAFHGTGTVATVTVSPAGDEPAQVARRVLYEVAVEAVGNARRHARAAAVDVRVTRDGGSWLMEVSDDGVGTDRDSTASTGFGLRLMRQRAMAAGGSMELLSAPGGGTTVRVRVPDHPPFLDAEREHPAGLRGPLEHVLRLRQQDTDVASRVAHTWFVALASEHDCGRAVRAGVHALVEAGLVRSVLVDVPGIEVSGGDPGPAPDLDLDVAVVVVVGDPVGEVRVSWPGGRTPWTGELTAMLGRALAARLAGVGRDGRADVGAGS